MKKSLINARSLLIIFALGLALSGTLIASKSDSKESLSEIESLNQFDVVDISEVAILLEEDEQDVMIYDVSNTLVYQATEDNSDERLQKLLRTSDFLLQVDGIKYYRINSN